MTERGMTDDSRMENNMHAVPEEDAPAVVTALQMDMVRCHYCGTVWQDAPEHAACGVCHARLHRRKPDSLNRTWALLIAACILYIPANLFPVMITTTFMGRNEDTILSGIIYFWVTGSWSLAIIVFVASFLVPLFKLVSLLLLVWLAQTHSQWRRVERAKLYRVIEFIGRWSMLDVFVVALLAGLVQMEGMATIHAGVGVAAFGAVVVLTMFASLSFDPRLTWDTHYRK
jgi:paraquat-inducible protein A